MCYLPPYNPGAHTTTSMNSALTVYQCPPSVKSSACCTKSRSSKGFQSTSPSPSSNRSKSGHTMYPPIGASSAFALFDLPPTASLASRICAFTIASSSLLEMRPPSSDQCQRSPTSLYHLWKMHPLLHELRPVSSRNRDSSACS